MFHSRKVSNHLRKKSKRTYPLGTAPSVIKTKKNNCFYSLRVVSYFRYSKNCLDFCSSVLYHFVRIVTCCGKSENDLHNCSLCQVWPVSTFAIFRFLVDRWSWRQSWSVGFSKIFQRSIRSLHESILNIEIVKSFTGCVSIVNVLLFYECHSLEKDCPQFFYNAWFT